MRTRILAAGGSATETDPRQGRDIGVCAITAINAHELLVIERDNRGLGVANPSGRGDRVKPSLAVVGSKRVFKIDIVGATDVSAVPLPEDGNLAAAGIHSVTRDDARVFIDLAADTVLPNLGSLSPSASGDMRIAGVACRCRSQHPPVRSLGAVGKHQFRRGSKIRG